MLAVTIEGDYLGKSVLARESNAGAQRRSLAAIFWQSQTSSSGRQRDLRSPVAGSIIDHHNLCNVLPRPFHNICDVWGFVESRN
jgi:hypothetical protein